MGDTENGAKPAGATSSARHTAPFVSGLAGLATLAFAQPVLDLLGRNPQFLVAHRFDRLDSVLFAFAVGLVAPLGVAAASLALAKTAGFLGSRRAGTGRRGLELAVLGATAGLLAGFTALRFAKALGLEALWPLSLALVPLVAWLVARRPEARSFISYLTLALAAVPLLFLAGGGVRAATDQGTEEDLVTQPEGSAPVIFVIFDEWSVSTLLTSDGELDRERLPRLAAFADGATWYKNALTVADSTVRAVPAIVSGRVPTGPVPTLSDYPRNLFTLAGGSYEVFADEPVSRLCPPSINQVAQEPRRSRLALALADATIVWGHAVMPDSLIPDLPTIDDRWADFADGAPAEPSRPDKDTMRRRVLGAIADDRAVRFRDFVARIGDSPATERPVLHFIHSLLPHRPAEFQRDGRRYGRVRPLGLENQTWKDDPLLAAQVYERYEEQVEFVDSLLGELFDELEELGLYDDSAIVLVADHGVSFTAGASRRDYSPGTAHEILPVPLFIKAPGQSAGAVDERHVTTVDVLPTLVDQLGWRLPSAQGDAGWQLDGVSLTTPADVDGEARGRADDSPDEPLVLMTRDDRPTTASAVHRGKQQTLEWKRGLIPAGTGRVAAEPHPELRGRALASFVINLDPEVSFVFESELPELDPAESGRWISGVLRGLGDLETQDIAIAVDGRIARTNRADRLRDGGLAFGTLLPEDAVRGATKVEVFVLRERDGQSLLVRPASDLDAAELELDGEELVAVRFGSRRVPAGRMRGYVRHLELTDDGFITHGWAMLPGARTPADAVLVFDRDGLVATLPGGEDRPWVADNFGETARFSGFSQRFPGRSLDEPSAGLRFVAVSEGRVAELESLPVLYDEASGRLAFANGRVLDVGAPGDGLDGQVELRREEDGSGLLVGWAADVESGRRARRIAVFDGGQFREQIAPSSSADARFSADGQRAARAGFTYPLSAEDVQAARTGQLQLLALSARSAVRLALETPRARP